MQRARETCAIAGFGDVAKIDEGLREWDYGIYEGKTTKEIQAQIPGWSVWKNEIVGGETVEHVGERADKVTLQALAADMPVPWKVSTPSSGTVALYWSTPTSGKVALFAHAHILRILAARWIGLPATGGALLALGTGSVSVLGWERETRVIQSWNRGFE
jgi:probable phosphoglycerate mutase